MDCFFEMRFLEWLGSVFELHEIQFKIQDSKEETIWLPDLGCMPILKQGLIGLLDDSPNKTARTQ